MRFCIKQTNKNENSSFPCHIFVRPMYFLPDCVNEAPLPKKKIKSPILQTSLFNQNHILVLVHNLIYHQRQFPGGGALIAKFRGKVIAHNQTTTCPTLIDILLYFIYIVVHLYTRCGSFGVGTHTPYPPPPSPYVAFSAAGSTGGCVRLSRPHRSGSPWAEGHGARGGRRPELRSSVPYLGCTRCGRVSSLPHDSGLEWRCFGRGCRG